MSAFTTMKDVRAFARWADMTTADVQAAHREPVLDGFEHVAITADDSVIPIIGYLNQRNTP